ncbi:hypothetical protein RN001_014392 [Aquatica leii]|uniref:E3 ubiquitin-protein ligase E3D n=1 Tax=Aquatica leii TaxID=1421715 RepID=A0AAN7P0H9_9COLE|nr:hypothetical protein RN001_014392 [Aquatica leii]
MEIRPRIQSVNVFIKLFKPSRVVVNLDVDNFAVEIGSLKQVVQCGDFRIKPSLVTGLTNIDDQVSFRFATENPQSVSSYELLEVDMRSCTISNPNTTFLSDSVVYNISCSKCSHLLCDNVQFKRVLPLPENLDSSDWFCHSHDKFRLTPKENEIFYSQCFAYLHPKVLQGLKHENLVLKCDKCDLWLGTLQKDAFKIWFNTVTFTSNNIKYISCPLSDCLKTVLVDNAPLYSARVVLRCVNNPVEEILLLWLLEPKLRVKIFSSDGTFEGNVAKVLYKPGCIGSKDVAKWMSDVDITVLDVSKMMIDKLREHLIEMSVYIPRDFSNSNGFLVSYIKLCGDFKN